MKQNRRKENREKEGKHRIEIKLRRQRREMKGEKKQTVIKEKETGNAPVSPDSNSRLGKTRGEKEK